MRAPRFALALLSAGLFAAGLIATPAQASAGTFTLSWQPDNGANGALKVTASANLAPFGDIEVFLVSAPTPNSVRIEVIDGEHTLVPTTNCVVGEPGGDPTKDLVCTWKAAPTTPRVTVDFTAASIETRTLVASGASTPALTFLGGSGADSVQGGDGADEINGGPGDDFLSGGAGEDKIGGDEGRDYIDGEEGADSIHGGPDSDELVGGDDPDSITGGPGVDIIDAEDNERDTYVNCDNAPGAGEILFDIGLDLPFDCPVTMEPTAPRDFVVDSGSDSMTASWAPPEFDGNEQITSYALSFRPTGSSRWAMVYVSGEETSHTFTPVEPGSYEVGLRAVNSEGFSDWAGPITVEVTGAPGEPIGVQSIFMKKWKATLSWQAPTVVEEGMTYQVALRVKDSKNKKWLAWTTLPETYAAPQTLEVGDDLRLVNKRVYQFRVRTVKGETTSDWVTSEQRFVGNFEPLRDASLSAVKKGILTEVTVPGLAWRYNTANVQHLLAARYNRIGARSAWLELTPKTPTVVSLILPGPADKNLGKCWVALYYTMPGTPVTRSAAIDAICP